MILIVFRSRLTPEAGDDYGEMAAEMLATAREMPGFVDMRFYQAEDGERLTLVRWQDLETLAAWRNHPRHRVAQQNGRAKWYEFYNLEVAEVVRDTAFDRSSARARAASPESTAPDRGN